MKFAPSSLRPGGLPPGQPVTRTLSRQKTIFRLALISEREADRIGMWFVGWNEVVAISNPPPAVNARRCPRLNLPRTSLGVRYTNVLPGCAVGTTLLFRRNSG